MLSNRVKGAAGALSSFHCVLETFGAAATFYCLRTRLSMFFICPLTALITTPYMKCLDSALAGRSSGSCFNQANPGRSRRCLRCSYKAPVSPCACARASRCGAARCRSRERWEQAGEFPRLRSSISLLTKCIPGHL